MSNVTVTIAARKYSLSCAPEDSRHVEALAAMIDERLAMLDVKGLTEARAMLYAALFLADELHRANARLAESDKAPCDGGGALSKPETQDANAIVLPDESLHRLAGIASRMENLADLLESDIENV